MKLHKPGKPNYELTYMHFKSVSDWGRERAENFTSKETYVSAMTVVDVSRFIVDWQITHSFPSFCSYWQKFDKINSGGSTANEILKPMSAKKIWSWR